MAHKKFIENQRFPAQFHSSQISRDNIHDTSDKYYGRWSHCSAAECQLRCSPEIAAEIYLLNFIQYDLYLQREWKYFQNRIAMQTPNRFGERKIDICFVETLDACYMNK